MLVRTQYPISIPYFSKREATQQVCFTIDISPGNVRVHMIGHAENYFSVKSKTSLAESTSPTRLSQQKRMHMTCTSVKITCVTQYANC